MCALDEDPLQTGPVFLNEGHVGVAGGDRRNEVVDASFALPYPAARPT